MFGFTEGTDIGRPGQPEVELESIGRFGREGGPYSALTTTANLKYPVTDSFRIAGGLTVSHYNMTGVTGLDDRNQFAAERVTLEVRWRMLDRETAPIGLTFVATPFFGFVDNVSGTPSDAFGAELIAAADQALIPGRLFAAVNLVWQFARIRPYATGAIEDGSLLGFTAAMTVRVTDWLYLGGEARYLRAFDGLALNSLAGQAVYAGPTFYMPFARGVSLSGGWNIQAWGQASGLVPGLDPSNFENHLVKLRLAIDL